MALLIKMFISRYKRPCPLVAREEIICKDDIPDRDVQPFKGEWQGGDVIIQNYQALGCPVFQNATNATYLFNQNGRRLLMKPSVVELNNVTLLDRKGTAYTIHFEHGFFTLTKIIR